MWQWGLSEGAAWDLKWKGVFPVTGLHVLWVLEAVTLSKGHPLVLGPPRDVDSDRPRPQFNPFICFLGALMSIPCPRACSFPPFKW